MSGCSFTCQKTGVINTEIPAVSVIYIIAENYLLWFNKELKGGAFYGEKNKKEISEASITKGENIQGRIDVAKL